MCLFCQPAVPCLKGVVVVNFVLKDSIKSLNLSSNDGGIAFVFFILPFKLLNVGFQLANDGSELVIFRLKHVTLCLKLLSFVGKPDVKAVDLLIGYL